MKILFAILTVLFGIISNLFSQQKVAILIGSPNDSNLSIEKNIEQLSETLKTKEYTVNVILENNSVNIINSLKRTMQLHTNSSFLIHIGGHGLFNKETKDNLIILGENEFLSINQISKELDELSQDVTLIIDSCFSGFKSEVLNMNIISSCQYNQLSFEDSNGSIFAGKLNDLLKNNIKIEDMCKEINKHVINETNGWQKPNFIINKHIML